MGCRRTCAGTTRGGARYCGTYVPTKSSTKFSYGAGLGVRADIGRSFTVRGWVSQQYIEVGSVGFTPFTQWRA